MDVVVKGKPFVAEKSKIKVIIELYQYVFCNLLKLSNLYEI
jgi:hypothetical protein